MAPFDRSAAETTTFSSSRHLAILGARRGIARDPGLETLAFVMRILALHGNRCAADASATDPTSRACRSLAFRSPLGAHSRGRLTGRRPSPPLAAKTARCSPPASPRTSVSSASASPRREIVFLDAPLELPADPGTSSRCARGGAATGGGGGRAFEGWETSSRHSATPGASAVLSEASSGSPRAPPSASSCPSSPSPPTATPTPRAPSTRPGYHPDAPFASLEFAILCAGYVPAPSPVRAQGVRPVDGARRNRRRAFAIGPRHRWRRG